MQATIISSWSELYQERKSFLASSQGPTVCRAERGKISQFWLRPEVFSHNKFRIPGKMFKFHGLLYLE